jgi:hypothetical protein
MKAKALVLSAIAAFAIAGLASNGRAAADNASSQPSREITIPGTVVSSNQGKLVIRTDDHGHRMAFDVASASTLPADLRKGAHVAVTYHPEGPTGQQVDQVQVVERTASVRSQAAFVVVTGGEGVRVGAR